MDFAGGDREGAYTLVRRTLVRLDYHRLGKPDKGLAKRCLAKVTGLSRAQLTRLIGLRRQWQVFGDPRFERLVELSNGHLYNLRTSRSYRNVRRIWHRTRPAAVAIGVRRSPEPQGQPGFLRVETVH